MDRGKTKQDWAESDLVRERIGLGKRKNGLGRDRKGLDRAKSDSIKAERTE